MNFRFSFWAAGAIFFGVSGCSAGRSTEMPDPETEINRTNYCVQGGLPREVQFFDEANPPSLNGAIFDVRDLDRISDLLDSSIASLLRESMVSAWQSEQVETASWNLDFARQLESSFAIEFIKRAPKRLNVEFCGDAKSVGDAVFTALATYFGRSVEIDEDGRPPPWLARHGKSAIDRRAAIVMIAVSLRLAKIEFDLNEFVAAFAQ
jgi:hypothetical protein